MNKEPDKNAKIILIAEDDETSYALLQVYLGKRKLPVVTCCKRETNHRNV